MLQKNVFTIYDFFKLFNSNIPSNLLKNELNKSNNKIIKTIMNKFNLKKKQINDIIGFIDTSQKFKIKNSVFDKGISCNSLKKKQFILYLQHILRLDETEIYSKTIKELCEITKHNLLELELNNDQIIYFKLML